MTNFCAHRTHHVLFAICSMMPEGDDPATYVGKPGWLPALPSDEAMRRAHKIACQGRYRTGRAAFKAARRFRRSFPEAWAMAEEHVSKIARDDVEWLAAPASPVERAAIDAAQRDGCEPW